VERAVRYDGWPLYRDATLEELVAATRANNADIRLAAAQVEEAEAVLRQARAALFPEITGGLQRSRTRVSSLTAPPPVGGLVRPDTRLFASTNFEVDFWGRLDRASEAARASLLGSRFARDVVTLSLGSLTAQTYFGLRSLDAQLAVLQETIRTRRDSVELARARLGAGLASELDLYQAQAALSDARVQRRDTERARALLEHQLGRLRACAAGLRRRTARSRARADRSAAQAGARVLSGIDRVGVPRSVRCAGEPGADRRLGGRPARAPAGCAQRAAALERALR